MSKMLAYCGLDCASCPAYLATQKNDFEELSKIASRWSSEFGQEIKPADVICDGCVIQSPRKSSYCASCQIRGCCLEKSQKNCASCKDFACQKLEEFFKHAPQAKENLDELRKNH